ncbi:MAG: cohesin domain-containing protein [Balneolaceae bacterium]
MKISFLNITICFFGIFLTVSCVDLLVPEPDEPTRNNPFDAGGSSFQSPTITADTEINTFGEFTISWTGGPSQISDELEYRYSFLDETTEWSADLTGYSGILPNDEYTFTIEARYSSLPNEPNANTEHPENFTVSTAPSTTDVVLYPRQINLSPGDTFSFESVALNITDLYGVNLVMEYDSTAFEVIEIGKSFRNVFDRQGIESSEVDSVYRDSEEIEFVQVMLDNSPAGINGFGYFSGVELRVLEDASSGTYEVRFSDNTDLRNTENESILEGTRGIEITVN